MRPKLIFITILSLTWLVGCNTNFGQDLSPVMDGNLSPVNYTGTSAGDGNHIGNDARNGNDTRTGNKLNTTNVTQTHDHPYNHNYDGAYSGEQGNKATNDIRSAQQVASRASEAAETISGVKRAVAIAEGMDIVVGIEANGQGDQGALEQKVKRKIAGSEQGYNVYVTTDPDITERIHTLFTNRNNVKTSFVSGGVSEIIYAIGQANGK